MDPATTCCPNLACPARGQSGQGPIGIHSRQDRRFIGTPCRTTFSATTGTVFDRLRTAAATVGLVVPVRAYGGPVHASVAAFGCDECTVAAWWARAGQQRPAVPEALVERPRALGQVHADELRVTNQGGIVWRALAIRGTTRLWRGGEGSAPRDRPLSRRLIKRGRCCAARRPRLRCTAGLVASRRARREPVWAPVHTGQRGRPRLRPWRHILMAHVVKGYERRRGGATERRRVAGPPARVEPRRGRAQGAGGSQTASIARLHATFRERLAPLARRGRALARHTLTLRPGRALSGTVDHCCPPHASLAHVGRGTTPALAAGSTDHGWSGGEWRS